MRFSDIANKIGINCHAKRKGEDHADVKKGYANTSDDQGQDSSDQQLKIDVCIVPNRAIRPFEIKGVAQSIFSQQFINYDWQHEQD